MKKGILIIGGVAALLVGAVVALAMYVIKNQETELNRKRTEKARETRLENLKAGIPVETEINISQDEKHD